jgi:UDP-glucose 4-epimerase
VKYLKKILIIGASGFIGKNIYEYLNSEKDRYDVYIPSSSELDATDEVAVNGFLKQNYFDVIIHAAVHNPVVKKEKDSTKMLECSLRMFYNFEKNQHLYGKMLYLGSGGEFDKRYNVSNITEEELGRSIPKDDYGFAKYIIAKSIKESKNIINLRLFGIYGKYEYWPLKFISISCCKAIKGIPISIRQNVYFDFLFIEDFCKIIEWFILNKPKYKDYNVSTGDKIDLYTLAQKVVKISEKKLPIYICRDGLDKEYSSNNQRLIKEIGNFKFTDVDVAIKKLYAWYCENEEIIDLYPLLYQ